MANTVCVHVCGGGVAGWGVRQVGKTIWDLFAQATTVITLNI